MQGLRRSDEIPHDFQSQPSSGRVSIVYMIMYNPVPQRPLQPASVLCMFDVMLRSVGFDITS